MRLNRRRSFITRIFAPSELVPPQWSSLAEAGPSRVFNPAILASAPGYLMAYRVVLPDGLRRLAICRLDKNLTVVPGSQVPLSDLLSLPGKIDYPPEANTWFADPRLIVWDTRLLIHWNSGCHEPANHQFVQELHPGNLTPAAPSAELTGPEKRKRQEKNWGLFAPGDSLYCVYSLAPLRILRLGDASGGKMVSVEVHSAAWNERSYTKHFGEMRGGAPPVLVDGRYYVIYHSCFQTRGGSRYAAGCIGFSAKAPFAPETYTELPLPLANPFGTEFLHERLNAAVAEVIYPCGAACEQGRWLVSYGINDEHCAIAAFDHGDLIGRLSRADPSRRWDWLGAGQRARAYPIPNPA